MGRGCRVGDRILWDAHHAQDQGVADLPTDSKPQSCPASPRPHEAGEHGAISRDRSRRRSRASRADGRLTRRVAPRPGKVEERPLAAVDWRALPTHSGHLYDYEMPASPLASLEPTSRSPLVSGVKAYPSLSQYPVSQHGKRRTGPERLGSCAERLS